MTRAAIQFAGILAILIGVGAASLVAPGLVFVAAAEGYFQDLRIAFLSARPGAQDTRVSVVSITEKTLAGLPYRSPVSRGFLADLLIAVDRAGAKAIAFDIFFDQATVPEQDAALIAAIRGARAPVAAATFLDRTTQTAAQRAFQDTFIRDSQALKGYADLPLDGDGVVRAHPDSLSPTETSLSAALVESTGFDASRSRGQIAWRRAHKAGEAAFQVLPAQLVIQMSGLNPGLVETWLGGRLVLIGADLPIDDQFRTPLNIDPSMGQTTAGVIVHAQAALQLLDGIALRRASRAEHFWILAVLGLAEIHGAIGSPKYLEYAADIGSSGEHLLSLITDLLDVAKIESGHVDLVETEIDVDKTVDRCQALVADQASRGQITFSKTISPEVGLLHGDRRIVTQILLNLLSNAVKFTEAGGCVDVAAAIGRNGELVLAVKDTGVGLAPEDIPKALETFGQVENPLSGAHKGTGLGLPLVQSFAEMHGGRLEIESELGVGTTVSVVFPRERVVHTAS